MIIEATARASTGTATSIVIPGATSARQRAERAVGAFIAGYSNPRTQDAYRRDLKFWLNYLDELGVDDPIHDATRSHVEVMVRRMEAAGRMPATIDRRIGTVKSFYEYLVDEEILIRNPARRVKRPHVPSVSTTPWLTRRELADWVDAADDQGGYTAAACMLLAFLALRVGELCSLNIECYREIDYHHVLDFIGKGSKPAQMPVPPRAVFALKDAIGERTSGPLILNQWGHRSNRENIHRMVLRVARHAGISKHISPHSLRHSAITAALDSGVPLRDVQHFARHNSADTTGRYDRGGQNLNRNPSYTIAQVLAS